MTLSASSPLTPQIASEVCQRAGSKAYIAGSVASIGNEYVVGLKAVNCQSGDTLALEQVHADGKEKVLDALGAAGHEATRRTRRVAEFGVQKFDSPSSYNLFPGSAKDPRSPGSKVWNEQGQNRRFRSSNARSNWIRTLPWPTHAWDWCMEFLMRIPRRVST